MTALNLCRVCLQEGGEFSLYEDDQDMKLYLKIMACSTIQISEADGYPNFICPLCYSMLDTAYKFKQKCEDSDIKLRTCVTKLTVKIEVDDFKQDVVQDDLDVNDSQEYDNFYDDAPVKEEYIDDSISDIPLKKLIINKKSHKNKSKWKIAKKKQKKAVIKLEKNRKIKPEFSKLKLSRPKKPQVETNLIASSLLEGQCAWNGFNWRFSSQPVDSKEEIRAKKEADVARKLLEQERSEQASYKLKQREMKMREKANKVVKTLCDICGQVFNSRNRMRVHQISHKEKGPVIYKCPDAQCKKAFKLAEYLARHVKRCHGEKKEFVCNECGKQFAFISSLKKHMKIHSGIVEWKTCPHCPQKYKTQKSVDIHIKSAHTGERPHICTMCDSAFFHIDYLKEHMRLHTGETPFKCPICKRGYAQRGNMKSHMKQHRMSELDEHLKATMKPNYLKLLRDC